jgi:hypothetical protein
VCCACLVPPPPPLLPGKSASNLVFLLRSTVSSRKATMSVNYTASCYEAANFQVLSFAAIDALMHGVCM